MLTFSVNLSIIKFATSVLDVFTILGFSGQPKFGPLFPKWDQNNP